MATQSLSIEEWRKMADSIFEARTGCDWADLCGDEEPVKASYLAGETPMQFVEWWCEKYGLWDIREA